MTPQRPRSLRDYRARHFDYACDGDGKVAKPAMPARLIILKAGATATRREQVRI